MSDDRDAEQYFISERFEPMLAWYDARAVSSKKWYRIVSVYAILASFVLVPIASLTIVEMHVITTAVSCTIGAATALLAHFKWHEDWLRYRSTWDSLQRERSLYETRTDHYAQAGDPFRLFVERCEELFCREGTDWYQDHSCQDGLDKLPSETGKDLQE